MSIDHVFQSIEHCIGPYYKKRLKLFQDLIGTRIIDALLYMPISTIEKFEVNELSNNIINKHIITSINVLSIEYSNYSKTKPIVILGNVGDNQLELLFFNYKPVYLKGNFEVRKTTKITGKLTMSSTNTYQIINPQKATLKTTPGIYSIYPLRTGITMESIYSIIKTALNILRNINIPEWLPEYIINKYQFYSFCGSLLAIHNPQTSDASLLNNIYRRRLCFDEVFAEQLTIQISKSKKQIGQSISGSKVLINKLLRKLPFKLTQSQIEASNAILSDMTQSVPMRRLLQGDVGSGKTIVAILAMLYAIEGGYQCALLTPTEMLARQHFHNINKYLNDLNIITNILTSNEKGKYRKQIFENIQNGTTNITVGTHTIFNNNVEFYNLGLVIIDEQHRFGVNQRLQLINKGKNPHVLSMTATPIPRTIIMSLHGDIDVSSIVEKPIGRKDIITTSLVIDRIPELIVPIKRVLKRREKVYWVCPLIEDSEVLDYTCVINRYNYLKQYFGASVDILHGKMKLTEKQQVFDKFLIGETSILVSTTVIEVGIDAPDATVVIIENAERFGLSQLHQLRGRVGRSDLQSYCVLLHDKEYSNISKQRINVMKNTNDGFIIAEEDLKLRGGGEINGTKQSGLKKYKTFESKSTEDQEIINDYIITANKLAKNIISIGTVELYKDCLEIFAPDFKPDITSSF